MKVLPKIGRFLKQNSVLFKFYGLLLYFILLFFLMLHWDISHKYIAEYFPKLIAAVSGFFLNLVGIETKVTGINVQVENGFGFTLVYHCAGIFAMIIYISAVLAYPARFREKLLGLVLGLPFLNAVNITRVIILGIVGNYYPRFFDFFHEYLWQGIFIVFVIGIWMIWREKFVKGEKDTAVPD